MLWAPCGICQIWKYVNWMRAYISVRISLIKRVSSGPPCCFGVVRLVLSIHDKGQQMENTKELVYEFLEKELKIANPRDRIEFQRIHRLGKPSERGLRLIIARCLRFSDREEVWLCLGVRTCETHQCRKTKKTKKST